MTTKEMAVRTIERLPDDTTWDDIRERIEFMAAVRKGLGELDEGKGVPHGQVREEFAQWLSR
jgi:predicted transcriptional regulator